MKQVLNKMRIINIEMPWCLKEYNRQFNREFVEIHFCNEGLFHNDYGKDVDPEIQGYLQVAQIHSLDRYKLIWDMARYKYEGNGDKYNALVKRLMGKTFKATLYSFSVKQILKKCGLSGECIRIINSDTVCRELYKIYIGESVDENKALCDIAMTLVKHFARKNIEIVNEEESYFVPCRLELEQFYITDLDFDEYYRFREEEEGKKEAEYDDADSNQIWTQEELDWAYAAAFEFDPNNQYGIID